MRRTFIWRWRQWVFSPFCLHFSNSVRLDVECPAGCDFFRALVGQPLCWSSRAPLALPNHLDGLWPYAFCLRACVQNNHNNHNNLGNHFHSSATKVQTYHNFCARVVAMEETCSFFCLMLHNEWFPDPLKVQRYWFGARKPSFRDYFERLGFRFEAPLVAVGRGPDPVEIDGLLRCVSGQALPRCVPAEIKKCCVSGPDVPQLGQGSLFEH